MSDKLIIFDYSGTLSLGAAAFSHSDNLMRYLLRSGLAALGVDNPALFWKIVNATWLEGSTTRLGYKAVLQVRIAELFPEKANEKKAEIYRASANFVDAYLEHSRIDGNWRPILKKLSLNKSVDIVIATDHYAEATDYIIKHLEVWNIQAAPFAAANRSNVIVANSADIGMHKEQQQFWQMLKNNSDSNYKHILLIDDFGQNEQHTDVYADPIKINTRRQKTSKILKEVFATDIQIISFTVKDKNIRGLIAKLSATIDQFLLSGDT